MGYPVTTVTMATLFSFLGLKVCGCSTDHLCGFLPNFQEMFITRGSRADQVMGYLITTVTIVTLFDFWS